MGKKCTSLFPLHFNCKVACIALTYESWELTTGVSAVPVASLWREITVFSYHITLVANILKYVFFTQHFFTVVLVVGLMARLYLMQ